MRTRDTQETLTKRTALKPSTDFSFPFARRARLRFPRRRRTYGSFLFSQFFCIASTGIPCRGFIRRGVDECCAREETVRVRERDETRRDESARFRSFDQKFFRRVLIKTLFLTKDFLRNIFLKISLFLSSNWNRALTPHKAQSDARTHAALLTSVARRARDAAPHDDHGFVVRSSDFSICVEQTWEESSGKTSAMSHHKGEKSGNDIFPQRPLRGHLEPVLRRGHGEVLETDFGEGEREETRDSRRSRSFRTGEIHLSTCLSFRTGIAGREWRC